MQDSRHQQDLSSTEGELPRKEMGALKKQLEESLEKTASERPVQNGEEHVEQLQRLFDEAKTENEALRSRLRSVLEEAQQARAREERLLENKARMKKELMWARHDVQTSRLEAKQAKSHASMLNRRLKEVGSSAQALKKRIAELKGVQGEIRTLLKYVRELCEQRRFGAKLMSVVKNGGKKLSGFKPPLSHIRKQPRPESDAEVEGISSQQSVEQETDASKGEEDANQDDMKPQYHPEGIEPDAVHVSEARSPSRSNDNQGEVEADGSHGLFRRITDRLRGKSSDRTSVDNTGSVEQRRQNVAKRGLRKLGSLKRFFSRVSSSGNSRASEDDGQSALEAAMKTIEALEKDVSALEDVIGMKQSEIDRLQHELRAAMNRSDGFERVVKKKTQRIEELKHEIGALLARKGERSELNKR